MEILAAAPIPTNIPTAIMVFVIGKVTPTPASALVPTNCPTNIVSTAPYSAFTSIPTTAGMENLNNNFPILSFSNDMLFSIFSSLHYCFFQKIIEVL